MIRIAIMAGLALALASCASPVLSQRADPLCAMIADCLEREAICVHVGPGPLSLAELMASDAYQDMGAQMEGLGGVHLLSVASLAPLLDGASAGGGFRTLIFGKGGEALVYPEVFADDATQMASFFRHGGAPPPGFVRSRVSLKPGACR
jgi:hypothetical protein